MEIKQLKRFLAVLDHGSLSGAAKSLGITQQAMSTTILNLESELDLPLFDRSPGGVTRPTPYGHALVRHAQAQMAGIDRATQELHAIRDATSGTVTIGIGETFVGEIMAAAVARLHRLRPEIRINLIEGYSEVLIERLQAGEFDFLAGDAGGQQLPNDLTQKLLYSGKDIIAARAGHPLVKRKNLNLADLQPYTWMIPYSRASDFSFIIDAFVLEGLEPPKKLIGTDAYMVGMHLMLRNDFLIMTTPALIGQPFDIQHQLLVALDIDKPTVQRNACLIYRTDHPLSPAASMLYGEVEGACQVFLQRTKSDK